MASAWVKELPADEQRAALLWLLKEFDEHYSSKILPANQDATDKAYWAIRVLGWSRFFVSQLATKNDDMRAFYASDAMTIRELSMRWDRQKWSDSGRQAGLQMQTFLRSLDRRAADRLVRNHSAKLKSTGSRLIVESTLAASGKSS